MDDKSIPEGDADQNFGGNQPLPESNANQPEAGEPSKDTTEENGSTSQSEPSSDDSSSKVEGSDDLDKWAKSQGIDLDNPTAEQARKLAKRVRDTQKAMHDKANQAKDGKKELAETVDDLHDPSKVDESDEYLSIARQTQMELAQMRAKTRIQDFYRDNPAAEEYAPEMKEALETERKQYGDEAARHLAQNLPRLLREAKAIRGEGYDADAAKEAGRREERELLRRRQEGSSEGSSAQQSGSRSSSNKVTRSWIASTYDSSNPEHRQMLDEAMARGPIPEK